MTAVLAPLRASVGSHDLPGCLVVPDTPTGLVLFAHASGSSRLSRNNTVLAEILNRRGFATYLFDLLDTAEAADGHSIADIDLLGARVAEAIGWAERTREVRDLPIGLFGSGTGTAAALVAAVAMPHRVRAVASRAGRPDLAGDALDHVRVPTSLIVGSDDHETLTLTFLSRRRLACESEIVVVPGAGPRFEEPGAIELVGAAAGDWFARHLRFSAAVGQTAGTRSTSSGAAWR